MAKIIIRLIMLEETLHDYLREGRARCDKAAGRTAPDVE